MPEYRKKPVVISAILYDWNDEETTADEAQDLVCDFMKSNIVIDGDDDIEIATLEGTMYATKGDYIIKGVNGEFYPCKPDIFTKTYDLAGAQFDFGEAVRLMKLGERVQRAGWNGKGMFVYLVPAASYPAQRNTKGVLVGEYPDNMVPYREYLALKTAQNDIATWAPSTSDALATDWQLT